VKSNTKILSGLKHFICTSQFSNEQVYAMLQYAIAQKALAKAGRLAPTLSRKMLAMIFEKPSLRTRVSFEVGMAQLGGHAVNLDQKDIGMGKRESVEDVARVLGRMCDCIMARTFSQEAVDKLAQYSGVPVINGLTDYLHPCQAMADIMTVLEHFGKLSGLTLAFIGDGNNVARSLAMACAQLGMNFVLTCPPKYELEQSWLDRCQEVADGRSKIEMIVGDAKKAVASAQVLYTDTWVSMGQEAEKEQRVKEFAGFQINEELLAAAPKEAIVLHCLPAYRGTEITDAVMDGPQSRVFEEAENRLHFQRALMELLVAGPQE
jgi:ornithine carbamoyltransferase